MSAKLRWTPVIFSGGQWKLVQQHREAFMLAHPYYPGCGKLFFSGTSEAVANVPTAGRLYQTKWKNTKNPTAHPKIFGIYVFLLPECEDRLNATTKERFARGTMVG